MATPATVLEFFNTISCHDWMHAKKARETIKETKDMIIAGAYSKELTEELIEALCDYYRQEGINDGQNHAREYG